MYGPFSLYLSRRLLVRGETSGRSDDNAESIRKRFRTFQEESKPIIDWYNEKGMVKHIVADQTVEQVWAVTETFISEKIESVLYCTT